MVLKVFNKPLIAASAADEVPSETDCELDAIRSTSDSTRRRKRSVSCTFPRLD